MSLKGNLASVNLTEIFQMLSLSGREGTLFIYEGPRKRAICFTKEGVSIRSRERNEANLIGKILVRLGKIDERALEQAVEMRRSQDKLLGDLLVERNACAREDVELALRIQSEEEIQDLFLNRSDAQFEYVDGYFPESEIPYVSLNVNSLLIEIARRTDEWEYIRRRIRGPREIYRFTGDEGTLEADVLAECYAHRVDSLIDGSHSVGEVIELSYVNKFEVCKLLAAYLDAGVIELVPPDAIRQNARLALRMGDAQSAIRHYEYLMGTGDFPLDIMSEAAEAHEANRDFVEAAALLRRLAEELVRVGDYRGALDSLRRVANYPRPEPDALRYLMELVFENPRAAAEFSANIVEAGKTLVAYYVGQDQRSDALALLERLIRGFPDEVAFAVSLVNVYYEENNLDQAATECERLANSFLKRKRPSHAVSLYKKLLVIDPERSDIRDKIRKIVAGRNRRAVPSAVPRFAIALAVMLLLGGVAVVVLNGKGLGKPSGGLEKGTLTQLWARAVDEKTSAAEHGRRAGEEYARLLEEIGSDPLASRESLLNRLRVADQRWTLFEDRAEKAAQIAETIRRQTANAEETARAQAMLDSLEEMRGRVETGRTQWRDESQRAAEKLRADAIGAYEAGRLRGALERYELARQLATKPEWKVEVQLDRYIRLLRDDVELVARKRKDARRREEEGDWTNARRILLGLLREYEGADLVRDVRLPVEILTVPPGATIFLDGVEIAQKTPAIARLDPHKATKVELRKKSFKPESHLLGPFGEGTIPAKYQYNFALLKTATWVRDIGSNEPIEADPVAWRNRVAVAGRNGRWRVFEDGSGKVIAGRRIKTLDGVTAGLATDGRLFFVPSLEGELFVYDATSCELLYRFTAPKSGIYASPAVADGLVYLVDFEGTVYAFDPEARRLVWKQPTPHGVRAAPVLQEDDLVVLSTSGNVTVIKRATGNVVIRYRLRGRFSSAPAVAGSKDLVFASEDGVLLGVGRLTGDTGWRQKVKTRITRTPPVKGRAVFVAPKPGELVAFDTRTGDVVYRSNRTSATAQASVLSTNRIFFANGQVLSAFAPRADGYGLAWTFEARSRILAGPVVHEGAVYIGDEKGRLYRLEAND